MGTIKGEKLARLRFRHFIEITYFHIFVAALLARNPHNIAYLS